MSVVLQQVLAEVTVDAVELGRPVSLNFVVCSSKVHGPKKMSSWRLTIGAICKV
jgi:hypothetical protein